MGSSNERQRSGRYELAHELSQGAERQHLVSHLFQAVLCNQLWESRLFSFLSCMTSDSRGPVCELPNQELGPEERKFLTRHLSSWRPPPPPSSQPTKSKLQVVRGRVSACSGASVEPRQPGAQTW